MLCASSLSAGASIPPPSGGLKEGGIIRDHVAGVGRVSALVPGCAVVTGGGSGLGRGIATALAQAGAPVTVVTPTVWERVIAINLSGTFYTCKRALVDMVAAQRGRIVNIASVAGVVGSGGGPAYTASKHGVVGLTRQLAITHAAQGITV